MDIGEMVVHCNVKIHALRRDFIFTPPVDRMLCCTRRVAAAGIGAEPPNRRRIEWCGDGRLAAIAAGAPAASRGARRTAPKIYARGFVLNTDSSSL